MRLASASQLCNLHACARVWSLVAWRNNAENLRALVLLNSFLHVSTFLPGFPFDVTMAPYRYSPLNKRKKQIRLLTLLPVAASAEIRIRIDTVALTKKQKPQYEALSYTWGSSEDPLKINVGPSRNNTLTVTQNLASALIHLRHEHEPRVLWIDAICIDQQNLKERGEQVAQMADVFSMADRVIVWLGPEMDNSKYALATLQDLSLEIEVGWINESMTPAADRAPSWADRSCPLPYDAKTLQAISDLLHRSWFERLWIWQEIILARPNAIVMCGNEVQEWYIFRKAIYCLYSKPWINRAHGPDLYKLQHRLTMVLDVILNQVLEHSRSLRILSERTKHCKCLDPRDRIFALIGLMPGKTENIKPNYTKSICQVYQEAVLYSIKRFKNLNTLRLCNIIAKQPNWPTWVPNLEHAGLADQMSFSNASGNSASEMQLINESTLEVKGIHVTTVRLVEPLMFQDTLVEDVIASIQRLVSQDDIENAFYIGGGSTLDAYCRTLCCDLFTGSTISVAGYPNFEKSRDALKNAISCEAADDPYLSQFHQFIRGFISGRRLFITEEGYVGLAPEAAKPQDQVCILLGCDTPMFLRFTEKGQYQVVGEGHVQGLMDAEALLGPHSERWQKGWHLDQDGRVYLAYVNVHTREVTRDDPRLGPISNGWRSLNHDQEKHYKIWENVDTGKQIIRDPRLTAEALGERGVNLQTFALV